MSDLKYLTNILKSYLLFLAIVALFGKGFSASHSLLIVLGAFSISCFTLMHRLRKIIFTQSDYFFVGFILIAQSVIGVVHFQTVINPDYFITNKVGISIDEGVYNLDNWYFAHLVDNVALFKAENGYFSVDLVGGVVHKNYSLAYLVSDLFYFGDAYVLNIIVLNLFAMFFSGIVLSLLANKIFGGLELSKRRMIFYAAILQPLAWIPSHGMRDIVGAFMVVLSVSLLYFSVSRLQKILFGILSFGLLFGHRSAYVISIAGTIVLRNISLVGRHKITGVMVLGSLALLVYFFISGVDGQKFLAVFVESSENSMLSGGGNERNASLPVHVMRLLVGPFPWTQYIDGSVPVFARNYASIACLQAAWGASLIFIVFKNISRIFASSELRSLFYVILLFGIPAAFSVGGHNVYLFPAFMLSLIFIHLVSVRRLLLIFTSSVGSYLGASSLYFLLT
ncbi:hypothetical protein N9809_01700 [Amylibacter sp.]|nr:hypothetical protein [Amylibacter sp.]